MVAAVDYLLKYAFDQRASDIHLEPKADMKKRFVQLDLDYSFGSGEYTIVFEGTFDTLWKTYTGAWSASALGSGTFTMTFIEEPVAARK